MSYPCGCCTKKTTKKFEKVVNIFFENSLDLVIKIAESEYGRTVVQTSILAFITPVVTCFCCI